MPRIGEGRALKWALENCWAGRISVEELHAQGAAIRRRNWEMLGESGVDFVPSNDFSLYDHVLDAALAVGAVPERFRREDGSVDLACYFAMARGGDLGRGSLTALELTKWFDTNYHHLVPEIGLETVFRADARKACGELAEAAALGISTVPVLLGPLTFLIKSAPVPPSLESFVHLDALVDSYVELLGDLHRHGATWVRLDEPVLVEDRSPSELDALWRVYNRLGRLPSRPSIVVSTYFGHVGDAMTVLRDLPVEAVGLDFCRGAKNMELLRSAGGLGAKMLFAGVVDGRNVWVNDFTASLALLEQLEGLAAEVVVSTSCSLMHVPASLAAEKVLDPEIRPWLAFAQEKLAELALLARGRRRGLGAIAEDLATNRRVLEARQGSSRVVNATVRSVLAHAPADPRRAGTPEARTETQRALGLPLLPTTTIGSFPQSVELRAARAARRGGRMTEDEYQHHLRAEIDHAIALQEERGFDVLVHGEPERDDMVRYFAAQLSGFALPEEGWVQSYGSRCVRPPVLFGDVARGGPMTLEWSAYARSRTDKPVKGILTGPVTMLRWSFVRDDQPEADTAAQLGLAMREELVDLQQAGTTVIQVDEPALREGLPLRSEEQSAYLDWATRAFRLVSSAADPATQVHTHMCYAPLGDRVDVLADLDVDVVSLEAARSNMALVSMLASSAYHGALGPGVYDVHSAVAPDEAEIETLLRAALEVLGPQRLWVNPDCGLKTRTYQEISPVLGRMVDAAHGLRSEIEEGHSTTEVSDAAQS